MAHVSRLLDLDHAFALAQTAWTPEIARIWMHSPNGHLDAVLVPPMFWPRAELGKSLTR